MTGDIMRALGDEVHTAFHSLVSHDDAFIRETHLDHLVVGYPDGWSGKIPYTVTDTAVEFPSGAHRVRAHTPDRSPATVPR